MTKGKTKAVVFDLWNTLAYNDTSQNPIMLLERRFGLKIDQYKKIERAFMLQKFPSILEAAKHICECMGREPDPALINDLLDIYDKSKIHFEFFPDVMPELERLRQKFKIGLVSNTDCFTMKPFFEAGHKKHFDYIAFSYETGMLKPNPDLFLLVLEKLGVNPEEAVMVGDWYERDIEGAKKLGMKTVLVGKARCDEDYCVRTFKELQRITL